MKTIFFVFLTVCSLLGVLSCSKESDTPAVFATDLVYAKPQLETLETTSAKSDAPTLKGTAPFTFSASSVPATSAISIDDQGIISASDKLSPGTYKVSVKVTNAAGTQSFDNAFTVLINSKSGVTFAKDILPITTANCSFAGCHPNFLKFDEVSGTVTKMLDRVQRVKGSSGFMPNGREPLSAAQIALLKQWVTDGKKER